MEQDDIEDAAECEEDEKKDEAEEEQDCVQALEEDAKVDPIEAFVKKYVSNHNVAHRYRFNADKDNALMQMMSAGPLPVQRVDLKARLGPMLRLADSELREEKAVLSHRYSDLVGD